MKDWRFFDEAQRREISEKLKNFEGNTHCYSVDEENASLVWVYVGSDQLEDLKKAIDKLPQKVKDKAAIDGVAYRDLIFHGALMSLYECLFKNTKSMSSVFESLLDSLRDMYCQVFKLHRSNDVKISNDKDHTGELLTKIEVHNPTDEVMDDVKLFRKLYSPKRHG